MAYKEIEERVKGTVRRTGERTVSNLKSHWLDYVLLFFICLILGAFDIFILKRSDNFLKPEYWAHAASRMVAYVLAGILGLRVGYPRYKAHCKDLTTALERNHRLIFYKEYDATLFGDFIYKINIKVKKSAWKYKTIQKLKKLDKKNPSFFPLWYVDKDEKHFKRFLPNGNKLFKWIKAWKYKRLKARAEKYRTTRENLEHLLTEDYINDNIHTISVKYPIVDKNHFAGIDCNNEGYDFYKTSTNVPGRGAKKILNILLIAAIITLIIGAIAIDLDEDLLQKRVLGIVTIIINAILDIGLTIWQFLRCYYHCEKIVRQEDLKAILDQNEILAEYKKTLPTEIISKIDEEIIKQEQEKEKSKS